MAAELVSLLVLRWDSLGIFSLKITYTYIYVYIYVLVLYIETNVAIVKISTEMVASQRLPWMNTNLYCFNAVHFEASIVAEE